MKESFVFSPPPAPSLAIAGASGLFPVHRIYCVGRNYAAHAREMGGDPQREPPFFFSKPGDAVTASAILRYPSRTQALHHEVELVAAIEHGGRDIPAAAALDHVYGYAVGVDLTRRDLQAEAKRQGRPWDTAKGFDDSAPVSSIVPVADCGHPSAGLIELAVNGEPRQRGDLADMIWSVSEVIAELSAYYRLQPGDLVFTGTPEGVGELLPGDHVRAGIEGVGSLEFELADHGG